MSTMYRGPSKRSLGVVIKEAAMVAWRSASSLSKRQRCMYLADFKNTLVCDRPAKIRAGASASLRPSGQRVVFLLK